MARQRRDSALERLQGGRHRLHALMKGVGSKERVGEASMKFGASIWPFQWDPPYEDGISRIASLGFEAVELIGWDRENLHDYYTPKKVKELRRFAKLRALPRKTGAHPRGV